MKVAQGLHATHSEKCLHGIVYNPFQRWFALGLNATSPNGGCMGFAHNHNERVCVEAVYNPSEKGVAFGLCTAPPERGVTKGHIQPPSGALSKKCHSKGSP